MQAETKESIRKRLNRVEGQVRGVAGMIDNDRYCVDIINQMAAVRAALRRIEEEIIRDHVGHCVANAIRSDDADEQARKVDELIAVVSRRDR